MNKVNFITICNEFMINPQIALENDDLCTLLKQINNNGYNSLVHDSQVRDFFINNF